MVICYCGRNKCEGTIAWLPREGLKFDPENYEALLFCVQYDFLSTGKLLLDNGMNFEKFQEWCGENNGSLADNEFCRELAAHWERTHEQAQEEQADMGMHMA